MMDGEKAPHFRLSSHVCLHISTIIMPLIPPFFRPRNKNYPLVTNIAIENCHLLYVYQRVSVKPTCFCCGGNHLTSSLLAESRPAGGRLGTDAPSPGRSLWPVQKKWMFQGFSGDIPHITVFSLKLMLPGGVYKVTSGYGPIFSKPLRDHRQRDLGNIKNLSSDKAIQGRVGIMIHVVMDVHAPKIWQAGCQDS